MSEKPSVAQQPPRVALIVATSQAYGQELLRGVARWLRTHGPWLVNLEQRSLHDAAPPWLHNWDGDGIIFHASQPNLVRLVRKLNLPTVDVYDEQRDFGWPSVRNDNQAIGRLAAQHLIERGLRNFAFCGLHGSHWSNERLTGYRKALAAANLSCDSFEQKERFSWGYWLRSWEHELVSLVRWIKELPKPVGLFTCNDVRGLHALNACRQAGLSVPQDVAVIGVDNDEIACELASPEMSSVVTDARRIGFEAAKLLDQMMRSGRRPIKVCQVPPVGIVTRHSTLIAGVRDPHLSSALEFIKQNSNEDVSVDRIVAHVGVSRSLLQQKFRGMIGRTIHEVIVEQRVANIKELLETSDMTLMAIARKTGFSHVEYLSTMFKRQTGVSPMEYRRSFGKEV